MKKTKYLTWLLAAAMVTTPLSPALSAQAVEGDTAGLQNQVLDLKFEDNLTDSSLAAHNVVMGSGDAVYVEGVNNGKALSLNGSQYVNLGKETDLQPENLTLSFWLKPNADMTGEQIISWSKNEYNTDGWYLTAENANTPLALSIGPSSGQPYKVSVAGMTRAQFFPTGEWTHVVVTYDKESKEVVYYRNGVKCQTKIDYAVSGDRTGVLGSDASMEKSIGYNGPVYRGSYLNAAIDEYELYNDVATEEEVMELYSAGIGESGKDAVAQADIDALVIPGEVSGNINLPTTGQGGSEITWTSNNENVIAADGTVTRPEIGAADVVVKLTASASFMGSEAVTKEFTVTVKAKQEINISTNSIMGDVTLADDYLVNAAAKEDDYLLSLDSEKFLYECYLLAGLKPTTDKGYEGWERSYGNNFRGHAFGHYMSALSQAYLSSDDADKKAKLKTEIEEAVNGLKACQDAYAEKYPESAGYVSPFSEAWLQDKDGVNLVGAPRKGGDTVIVPYYNLHKILAGLIDVTENVDDQQIKETALSVAQGFGDYLYKRLITMHADKNRMLATEYGGMNEALYELYNITDNENYKEVAQMFDETALFTELANGNDVLSGKHANTTIPKLTGALKRYTVLTAKGEACDEMYLTAAKNFWDIVIKDHTYITGGNSQSEHFHDAGKIGYDATKGDYDASTTCETCNTYNMLKLSKALYQVTGDKKYMDYFENTYINAILSSQNPETGTTMYFQPMAPGYNKVFNRPFDEFWCCTGTGMENFSKLGDNIYQVNDDGASVHMFFSSTLNTGNLLIEQTANMPNSDTVTFEVKKADAGTVLRLRKPDWLAGEAVITVNGKAAALTEEAGYYKVNVQAGDKVTYQMPMEMAAYKMPDKPNLIAFKYGPVALSAALSTNNIEGSNPNGILVRVGTFDPTCQTVITVEADSVEQWLEGLADNMVRIEDSKDGQIRFQLKNVDSKSEELVYTPHYMRYKERYGLYMYMEIADSEAAQDRILEEKENIRNEEMSVDSLYNFDANNSEAAKNVQSENSGVGSFGGRTFRHVDGTGWFSYDLKIDPSAEKNYLNCTYYSGDAGRKFDLYINGRKLKTVEVNKDAGTNVFYVDTDEIPAEYLTEGSDKITVKFQSIEGQRFVGGLFGISTSTSTAYSTDARLKSLSFDEGTLTEEFNADKKEYVLEVAKDTESVNMLATPMMESGLVYVGDILIDDKHARNIPLTGDETTLTLTTKAQDHETSTTYTVTIKKVDAPVETVDKTPLVNKIDEAKAYKAEGYTQESYEALQTAIKNAMTALNEVKTEEDVTAAVNALEKAIKGLVEEEKPDEPENPGGSTGGNTGGNAGGSTDGNNSQNGSNSQKGNSSITNLVKTGDVAPVAILILALGAAFGAIIAIVRQRLRK